MPCSDGGYTREEEAAMERERQRPAQNLCWLMGWLTKNHPRIADEAQFQRSDLKAWWERHQEFDRQREAAERAERQREQERLAAIQKLTPAERKMLGL
jgi:hypothetical protein